MSFIYLREMSPRLFSGAKKPPHGAGSGCADPRICENRVNYTGLMLRKENVGNLSMREAGLLVLTLIGRCRRSSLQIVKPIADTPRSGPLCAFRRLWARLNDSCFSKTTKNHDR